MYCPHDETLSKEAWFSQIKAKLAEIK
jgi:hypothetical protein